MKVEEVASSLNIETSVAEQVVGLIEGTLDPDDYQSVQNWSRQCLHEPSKHDKVFCALNEIVEGFGIEAIWSTDSVFHPVAEYINMGDSYTPTICYHDKEFQLTDWASLVEQLEKEGVEIK